MTYQTGDKLLVFSATGVKIEWVSSAKLYASIDPIANRVRTSLHEADAAEGRGSWTNVQMTLPYSDAIWNAYQSWLSKRAAFLTESEREFALIRKGKIQC